MIKQKEKTIVQNFILEEIEQKLLENFQYNYLGKTSEGLVFEGDKDKEIKRLEKTTE